MASSLYTVLPVLTIVENKEEMQATYGNSLPEKSPYSSLLLLRRNSSERFLFSARWNGALGGRVASTV